MNAIICNCVKKPEKIQDFNGTSTLKFISAVHMINFIYITCSMLNSLDLHKNVYFYSLDYALIVTKSSTKTSSYFLSIDSLIAEKLPTITVYSDISRQQRRLIVYKFFNNSIIDVLNFLINENLYTSVF